MVQEAMSRLLAPTRILGARGDSVYVERPGVGLDFLPLWLMGHDDRVQSYLAEHPEAVPSTRLVASDLRGIDLTTSVAGAVPVVSGPPVDAATTLDEAGLTLLPPSNSLSSGQVDALLEQVVSSFNRHMYTLQRVVPGGLDALESVGFDSFKMRGPSRYDLTIPEFVTADFSFLTGEDAPWLPFVRSVLGDDADLAHVGTMLSMPGSKNQPWHQDGPALNADFACNHLPAHALNVFVPLVDVDVPLGPTEFVPGTHRRWDLPSQSLVLTPRAGQPLIFDYRVKHRGLGNTSTLPRPVLYITYTKNGWKDVQNFSRARYRKFPPLLTPSSRAARMRRRGCGADDEAATGKLPAVDPDRLTFHFR